MGALDQLAKDIFAEEAESVTQGAMAWELHPEIGMSEVRIDGMLLVRHPPSLSALPAPWSLAGRHDEIVLEIKMPGDHLGVIAVQRVLLRRQARQVQRVEAVKPPWLGEEPLWVVAPHVPAVLCNIRDVSKVAEGCYRVGPSRHDFLWIAANKLPLVDELIPFLIARSGRDLDDFARWVRTRRSPQWLLRVLQILPMSTTVRDELLGYVPRSDDPEIEARQRHVIQRMLEAYPDIGRKIEQQGIEKGLQPLVHLFERRLGRRLSTQEHATLDERFRRLGAARVGDVVFDLAPDALGAWLADPDAR